MLLTEFQSPVAESLIEPWGQIIIWPLSETKIRPLLKNNLNLCTKTKPFTAGADSTVYVQFFVNRHIV